MTAKRPASRSATSKTASTKKTATAKKPATAKKTATAARSGAQPKAKAKARASSAPRRKVASKPASRLREVVLGALAELKAVDVKALDVRGLTDITDTMVVASGTSDRHVRSVAEAVAFQAKLAGEKPLGTEGVEQGEWALIDLNGVVVHVMLPKVRDFYQIERLWSVDAAPGAKESTARDGA